MLGFLLAISVLGVLGQESPRLSLVDYITVEHLPSNRASLPAGFKYKYVGSDGSIVRTRPASGHWVEVSASPQTGETAHYEAALIVSHMTRHMPTVVFNKLAGNAAAGVFTRAEHLSVYPEYARLKDTPACRGNCHGSCAASCTFDGRKWDTVAGVGGKRGIVLDDNVLCDSRDPYRHHENILAHEFTHTIHHHALDSTHYAQIHAAYNHAKSANLWRHSAYAMANYEEYFAEGATAFFNVNQQTSAGGMNQCGGGRYCTTEQAARAWLKQHDPQLYNVLNYVFTNNRPQTASHLSTCQKN